MSESAPAARLEPPHVLLLGTPAARPEGLERALVRGGFQVLEADLDVAAAPESVLLTVGDRAQLDPLLAGVRARWGRDVAVLVLAPAHDLVVEALRCGADDALACPVDLEELVERIRVRVRRLVREAGPAATQVHDAMFDLVREVVNSVRPEEVLRALVHRVGRALDLAHCSFILTPPESPYGRVVAEYGRAHPRDFRLELDRYPEVREAMRTGRPVVIPDVHAHPLFEPIRREWAREELEVRVRSVVALPVRNAEGVMGVFLLRTRDPDAELSATQLAFADSLAAAAADVLQRVPAGAGVAPNGADPLTGLATPRALDRRVAEEFDRARRYSLSFTVALMDLDNLHEVNARFGVEVGDRVLAGLAALLREELRAPDFISRYGGDEFALVLPETGPEGAREAVTRVRRRIAAHRFPDLPDAAHPALSIGLVTFPHPAALETGDLLALAEMALLRAKVQQEERLGTADPT